MRKLHNLDPNEVSLVPRGANKKKFLITKSTKGNEMSKESLSELANKLDPKTRAKVEKAVKALVKKVNGVESPGDKAGPARMKKESGGDMPPKKDSATYKDRNDGDMGADHQAMHHGGADDHQDVAPLSERAQAALKAVSRIISPFKDELTKEHMGAVMQEMGMGGDDDGGEDMDKSKAIPMKVEDEHHAAALDMAEKAYHGHMEKMGYRKYPDPSLEETNAVDKGKYEDGDEDEDDEEESMKVHKSAELDLSAFNDKQRTVVETVFKAANDLAEANKVLIKKNGDLEKIVRDERDQRITKEYNEKASGLKHLGAKTEDVAEIMKSLTEFDEDLGGKLENILKAADEQARVAKSTGAGLFGEIGSRLGEDGTGESDAWAKLEAMVSTRVEKSDGTKSKEQIFEEVLKTSEGKRLYKEYKNSRKGGI